MIIRKSYEFESAHIVRGCSTKRCRSSLHGHSYRVEVLFESNFLDNGQMVYDFGLMKEGIKTLIDAFDHAITIWNGDDPEYVSAMKQHSQRWIVIPVSPTAEQFARLFFVMIDALMKNVVTVNGEKEVRLHSIIAHETDTGYAQCFRNDAYSELMGVVPLDEIYFSDAVKEEFPDPQLWSNIKKGIPITNPRTV